MIKQNVHDMTKACVLRSTPLRNDTVDRVSMGSCHKVSRESFLMYMLVNSTCALSTVFEIEIVYVNT